MRPSLLKRQGDLPLVAALVAQNALEPQCPTLQVVHIPRATFQPGLHDVGCFRQGLT